MATLTGYYVSAIDGPRKYLMLGPFDALAEALAQVTPAAKKADELDPRAWFMAWGTCKVETPGELSPGRLNRYMP
jgi:hypothetical protein